MRSGAAGVIYVGGGLVNLLTFGLFDVPQIVFDTNDSAVRVAVALNGRVDHPAPNDGPTQADGDFPAILAFNELGGYIGSSWDQEGIPSGGFNEVVVDQTKGPGQQATYLQFFARNDAVCIAYISQEWADGQSRGWLGDMGEACGRPWYYSHIIVGNEGYSPKCMWMDADHSDDPEHDRPAAMQIHMEDYTNLTTHDYSKDPAHYCRQESMIFHRETDPKIHPNHSPPKHPSLFIPNGEPQGPCCMKPKTKKRHQQQIRPRPAGLATRLISSPRDDHAASKLCESETSHGPDFVSHSEGVFCDMGTKTQWPLCAEGDGSEEMKDCYRWKTHSLVTGGEHVARNYASVQEWK